MQAITYAVCPACGGHTIKVFGGQLHEIVTPWINLFIHSVPAMGQMSMFLGLSGRLTCRVWGPEEIKHCKGWRNEWLGRAPLRRVGAPEDV